MKFLHLDRPYLKQYDACLQSSLLEVLLLLLSSLMKYQPLQMFCLNLMMPFIFAGLSYQTDQASLEDAFQKYGEVIEGNGSHKARMAIEFLVLVICQFINIPYLF